VLPSLRPSLFVLRQQRAATPLHDLHIARRRVFWVAAGGLIVFGSLMGALVTGQQFMQNELGYFHIRRRIRDLAVGRVHGARRGAVGPARPRLTG
jgi:hypothetical protein